MVAYADGRIDHRAASERLRDAATQKAVAAQPVDVLIALETLARSCGIFAASLDLTAHVRRAVDTASSRSNHVDHHLRSVVVAIHDGDRERAVARLDTSLARVIGSDARATTLAAYTDIWAGEPRSPRSTRVVDPIEQGIANAAAGRGVLVYGPGPTDDLPASCGKDPLVVRVMMPEVWMWPEAHDLARGRSDVAYMNFEAQGWLSGLDSARRREVTSRFSFFVCKKTDSYIQGFTMPNMRLARAAAPLFLSGSENTVPAIVFDLLSFVEEDITIVGSTFFASRIAYRDDSRRLRPVQGVTVNEQGSIGRPFERCSMLANHNALENRALVRNLVLAGHVNGDAGFTEVINWSDRAFMENLDEIYGFERI